MEGPSVTVAHQKCKNKIVWNWHTRSMSKRVGNLLSGARIILGKKTKPKGTLSMKDFYIFCSSFWNVCNINWKLASVFSQCCFCATINCLFLEWPTTPQAENLATHQRHPYSSPWRSLVVIFLPLFPDKLIAICFRAWYAAEPTVPQHGKTNRLKLLVLTPSTFGSSRVLVFEVTLALVGFFEFIR